MNLKTVVFVSCILTAFVLPKSLAQTGSDEAAEANPAPLIEFDLLVVQIQEPAALSLIPQLRDRKQSERAFASIMELVTAKKATLIGWPVLATKGGQRAVVEQIEEFRFATEYKGAEKIKATEQPSNETKDPGAPNPSGTSNSSTPPEKVRTVIKEVDAIPASFETRNVGVTLEIESAVRKDLRTIDISLVPQHVTFLEMRRVEIEDQKSGRKIVVEQPQFLTNRVTTSIEVQDGDYTLLGTFKVPKPQGYIELFILHTQIKKSL